MSKKNDVDRQLDVARQNVEILKIQLEQDIDVGNEMAYSDEELKRLLKRLPVVMFQASQKTVLKFIDFKEAKRRVKKELAIAMMQANANKDKLTSAEDRKAYAQNAKNVEVAEVAVIQAEAEYRMAEFHFSAYDNLYMAVKKMVEMRMAENAAQERANRT